VSTLVTALRSQLAPLVLGYSLDVCHGTPKATGCLCRRILLSTLVTALRSQLAPCVVGYSLPRLSRHSEAKWLLVSEDTRVHIGHDPPKPTGCSCRRILVSTLVTALRSQLAARVGRYSCPYWSRPSKANWLLVSEDSPCLHWSPPFEANWLLVSEDTRCHVCHGNTKPTDCSCRRILVFTLVTALRSQVAACVGG